MTDPTDTERLTQEQAEQAAGCWIDSSLGQYTGEQVISIAAQHGFETDHEQSTPECEFYHEEWEAAENYLNAHVAPEGYFFGSADHSSDWGLWKIEETDEEPETTSTPRCDQCTSATVNGIYTHEHGCPNQHKEYSLDLAAWITPEPDEPDFEAAFDNYEFDLGE